MRVLHTSDWHLGKSLGGISRHTEHEAFCDEVVSLCVDEQVDLVLLTGDVFDTYNPPIEAEELFFHTLARLGDGGRRAVVVIAGNHDSPDRLTASMPLASTHGVWIVGRPSDVPRGQPRGSAKVQLLSAGSSQLEVGLPSGEQVRIAALPYPSEARLGTMLSASMRERDLQAVYSKHIGQMLEERLAGASPTTHRLAASHLAIRSCMPSESERVLVGGAYQVDGNHLPASAAYTALGHLHLAQEISDAPSPAAYAGSPLAFRMSERNNPRTHRILSLDTPGGPVQTQLIPIQAGRPLVVWDASSPEEVVAGVEAGLHADAIIELRLQLAARLTHAEMAILQKLKRTFVKVRVDLPESVVAASAPGIRHRLPPEELFRSFYYDQVGSEPDEQTLTLFSELVGQPASDADVSDDSEADSELGPSPSQSTLFSPPSSNPELAP